MSGCLPSLRRWHHLEMVDLLVAAATVSLVTGGPVWRGVAAKELAAIAILAVAVGDVSTVIRLLRLRRAGRESEVAVQRHLLERGWTPLWKRAYLDLVFIALGLSILGINSLAGGLSHTPIEGTSLALSFYVLLAPMFLWLGVTFLAVRVVLTILSRQAERGRSKPLPSWRAATTRWTGRRPARMAVALILAALAVAFGTQVLAFAATYRTAKSTDAQAALGSESGSPRPTRPTSYPTSGPGSQPSARSASCPPKPEAIARRSWRSTYPPIRRCPRWPTDPGGSGPPSARRRPAGSPLAKRARRRFRGRAR